MYSQGNQISARLRLLSERQHPREPLKVVSLFSGCGGLDLGFRQAGFKIIWANESNPAIWTTYMENHPGTQLDRRPIQEVALDQIPRCDGIIGGPPCQSWSFAGSRQGSNDPRGKLFFSFVRILQQKQPKFFLAENVAGILSRRHEAAWNLLQNRLKDCGYRLYYRLLNAYDFGIPQTRKRLILIGIRSDLDTGFDFPIPSPTKRVLSDALRDLPPAIAAPSSGVRKSTTSIPNHEYFTGDFSPRYMGRNRVRTWEEPSFTIVATARHIPLHPQAPRMVKVARDQFGFAAEHKSLYHRLSVRECARIQTFPDHFIFHYQSVTAGYTMVGNAVPVELGRRLAQSLQLSLQTCNNRAAVGI